MWRCNREREHWTGTLRPRITAREMGLLLLLGTMLNLIVLPPLPVDASLVLT